MSKQCRMFYAALREQKVLRGILKGALFQKRPLELPDIRTRPRENN